MAGRTAATADLALRIFDHYDAQTSALGVNEIARRLGISRSSAHRLVSSLALAGFLVQEPILRKYRLGPRFVELSNLYIRHHTLGPMAHGEMTRLRDAFNETVVLSVRAGYQKVVVDHVECSHELRRMVDVGRLTPLISGATGLALVAWLPEADLAAIEAAMAASNNALTGYRGADLRARLAQVRERGYALTDDRPSLVTLAAPIRDYTNNVVGVLSITALALRVTAAEAEAWAPELLHSVGAVSRSLGHQPAPAAPVLAGVRP